ncbi:Protein CBG27143 [Caenorhabditis briggsae]|uniref:Protein CBG27143 n=1 Tax=Caenorhabditis briggsae TaxID=6238 RepID=B6IL53_CAEBR|nr:Protein CBG27143 [Caenorhabditis briggsae]CAS00606.1 Protein CBG27143 [Caenorhabditis briggsae]
MSVPLQQAHHRPSVHSLDKYPYHFDLHILYTTCICRWCLSSQG